MYLPATHRLESLWAAWTPCHELALNDLSDSLPTSVTSPTFHVFEQLAAAPQAEPPPEPQANATMTAVARTATRRNTLIAGLPVSVTRPPRPPGGGSGGAQIVFHSPSPASDVASVYLPVGWIAKSLNSRLGRRAATPAAPRARAAACRP